MAKAGILIATIALLSVFLAPACVQANEDCRTLNEFRCTLRPSCKGIYGPSFCDNRTCTADIAFKGCSAISPAEIENVAKCKAECASAGGIFYQSEMHKNPTCRGNQSVIDKLGESGSRCFQSFVP